MTPAERARMRDTLRAAVAQARLPGAELTHPGRFQPPASPPYDLVERFTRELASLGGTVHDGSDLPRIASIVRTIAAAERTQTVLAWDEAPLCVPGLLDALARAGLRVLMQTPETATSAAHRQQLATASIGLTGADAALAETGSVVVASGPGRGRLASLLPRVHVAIVRRSAIVESLPVLIARRPEIVTSSANFVCITGPSRTADIEHVLARGVHGPGEIHAVLID